MQSDPFYINPEKIRDIQSHWERLMSLIVWGDIHSDQIGKLPRARKRLLEVGENIRSFTSSKEWISQPRQQLKSALGSSIKLRDSLSAFETSCSSLVSGTDLESFQSEKLALTTKLMDLLVECENRWAEQLDAMGYEDPQ